MSNHGIRRANKPPLLGKEKRGGGFVRHSLCFFLSNGSENGIIEGKERVERKGIDNRLRFGVKYRKKEGGAV